MLRGVRGATTAISNDPAAIREATRKLLIAMTNRTLSGDGDGVNIDFEGVGSWTGATAAMTSCSG